MMEFVSSIQGVTLELIELEMKVLYFYADLISVFVEHHV